MFRDEGCCFLGVRDTCNQYGLALSAGDGAGGSK